MNKLFTPPEVVDLLGCEHHDLRNWRALPADHPRHLASTVIGCRHHYSADSIFNWLNRPTNHQYREVVLASFVPDAVRQSLFPSVRAASMACQLRATSPTPHTPADNEPASTWSTN